MIWCITPIGGRPAKLVTNEEKMKRLEQIKNVCTHWHGGQWSALYQFASSGTFVPGNILRYLKELQECREPEYNLHPGTISKRDDAVLKSAQGWFINQYGKLIVWRKHPDYGYMVPFLADDDNRVTHLRLAI